MNPFYPNDPTRQSAQAWSQNLGTLAASPAIRPETAPTQLDSSTLPLPLRLSSAISHLRQRARRREDAAAKLRVNEFVAGS